MYCTKGLLVVVSLVAVIQLTNAAVGFVQLEVSPEHPNQCFRKSDNLTLAIGESKILPDCTKGTCMKQGDKITLAIVGCGKVAESEGCTIIEDTPKPHPKCCPQLKCA